MYQGMERNKANKLTLEAGEYMFIELHFYVYTFISELSEQTIFSIFVTSTVHTVMIIYIHASNFAYALSRLPTMH